MYTKLLKHLEQLSSEGDREFSEHFIETNILLDLLTENSDVIFGTKGTGKTALSLALTELHKDKYLNTSILRLDDLSIERLYSNLRKLQSMIKLDITKISSIAWKNTLLNYAILSLSEVINDQELLINIDRILTEDGFINNISNDSDTRINNFVEKIYYRIENYFDKKKSDFFESSKISSLSPNQFNAINKFPLNKQTDIILESLISVVRSSKKKILITIDGLDSIAEHSPEARKVIFTGLIDAIFSLRLNNNIHDAFIFKAFIPQELSVESVIALWDSDKHLINTHYINWSKKEIENFLVKRFQDNNSRSFDDLWDEYMPKTVYNRIYNVEENTFDYILRHSLYRPRQVQYHLYKIISDWTKKPDGNKKIQGNSIPKSIVYSNRILAEKVSQELSHVYPNFIQFIKSWSRTNTTTTVKIFKDKINIHLLNGKNDYVKVNKIFDELYIFGIFGIMMDNNQPDFKTKSKNFHFSFVNDSILTSIHSSVVDSDIIAFSPMFREYCGLKPENGYIINPVEKDSYY